MNGLREELLTYSYKHNLSHIPSAISMLDYVNVLFEHKFVTLDDGIVIGKPFGSQAYYLIWRNLGYLDNIETLNVGVKHDEILFVNYSEETMGNALGVAAGIAMTTNQRIWVNISDAALQMGNTLEAIQFIGHNKIKNIFLTVDYNNTQVTGKVSDVLAVKPLIQFFKEYGWFTQEAEGHNELDLCNKFKNITDMLPNVVFCHTVKGHGVAQMEANPKDWHYRKIASAEELAVLIQNA